MTIALLALAGCLAGSSPNTNPSGGPDASGTDGTDPGPMDDGNRSHVHDRWVNPATGEVVTSIPLFDGKVRIDPRDESSPTTFNLCKHKVPYQPMGGLGTICLGTVDFGPQKWPDSQERKIVPPGTDRVEFEISWDASQSIAGVELYYRTNKEAGHSRIFHPISGPIQKPEGTKKVLTGVNVNMSDDGHATTSQWRFRLEAFGNDIAPAVGNLFYADGEVQVKVTAFRVEGPLPLEPPHPVFWNGTDTYQLGRLSGSVEGFHQVGRLVFEQGFPNTAQTARYQPQGLVYEQFPGWHAVRDDLESPFVRVQAKHVVGSVPVDTKNIGIVLHIHSDAEVGPLGTPRVCLRASTDADARMSFGFEMWCGEFAPGTKVTHVMPVDHMLWDSPYAATSVSDANTRWDFFVQVVAPEGAGEEPGNDEFSGRIDAWFFVTKADTLTVPAWADVPA